jgi:hypothetical protein
MPREDHPGRAPRKRVTDDHEAGYPLTRCIALLSSGGYPTNAEPKDNDMTRTILATGAALLALTAPATAQTDGIVQSLTSSRITAKDARYAATSIFTNYAGALDRRLIVSPCKPYAKRARACTVRVGSERYRVTAYYAQDLDVMASAKRLR